MSIYPDSPMSVHVNFRAAVWLVGFLRYGAPWHIPLVPANFCRVPVSVRSCGRHLSHRCLRLQKSKTATELPAKMLLPCLQKKNRCMGRRRHKEVAPPNTRAFDNLKTDADRRHERLQACRRHLHGGDIGVPRTSASSPRHRHCADPGAGGREVQERSAR